MCIRDRYNPAYRGKLGVGYLDAGAALSKDEGIAPEPVTDLQVEWKYSSAFLTWSVTRDEDNGKAAYYHIYWSTQSLEGIDVYKRQGQWDLPGLEMPYR